MFSTIHTAIRRTKHLVLIAAGAFVLAAGPGAPTASAAKTGGPVASDQTAADADQCDMYFNDWYRELMAAVDNVAKGNLQAADDALKSAQYTKELAASRGCTWAQASARLAPAERRVRAQIEKGDLPTVSPGDSPSAPRSTVDTTVRQPGGVQIKP